MEEIVRVATETNRLVLEPGRLWEAGVLRPEVSVHVGPRIDICDNF